MPGLGTSFGRGAATTYQQDLANSDCILFMGSNMAEAHPVGFRWPMKAKERGATLIHVDPRFSRTSALCDLHISIRAGTDIAFLGGLIHHVLSQEKWFRDYVLAYTNAAVILSEDFRGTEDLDGLFSGFDPATRTYDPQQGAWSYAGKAEPVQKDSGGEPRHDPTLQHPRCVMQVLRRHFARYTPAAVAEICGCTPQAMTRVAELLCANSGRERTSAIVYAVGWTQHSTGVQIIRTAGILQLLLGNIGRPGGGIMAMRGHASIQGSTDVPTLYDLLPGYLPQPTADPAHDTLDGYCRKEGLPTGYWGNFRKFAVSLLKAYYGSAATPDNDFGFGWLPRLDGDYSHTPMMDRMAHGEVTGYFLFGQNPAAGGLNAGLQRVGLRNLDWLVVCDTFETESAVFWKHDPSGPPPGEVKTEVFFLPAATGVEKEGTLTNTQRLLQWHSKALDPPGDCRSDAWIVYQLGRRLRQLYAGSTAPRDQPLLQLTWDYDYLEAQRLPDGAVSRIQGDPDTSRILQEINGCRLDENDPRTGRPKQLRGFAELRDDGTTACGCWIYSGVYPEAGRNRANQRQLTDSPVQPNWGFAWPHNRRIMYNRASAAPDGQPWSQRKQLIWWDASQRRWVGADEPDFDPEKPPDYRPPPGATGMAALAGDQPFIMKPDGLGWLYAPKGARDGPLPAHYEPVESPVGNLLYPRQAVNPTVRTFDGPLNRIMHAPTEEFPVVACTFRLTEHHLSGPMSRFNSWLNELQPEMFIEMSPELAAERGIQNGDWVTVRSARAAIEARAVVTQRLWPLVIEGRRVHQVGLPIHWGFTGEAVGGIANNLTSLMADVNVSMHEGKVFVCQVEAGRHAGRALLPTKTPVAWPSSEPVPDTPPPAQPEGKFTHDTPEL